MILPGSPGNSCKIHEALTAGIKEGHTSSSIPDTKVVCSGPSALCFRALCLNVAASADKVVDRRRSGRNWALPCRNGCSQVCAKDAEQECQPEHCARMLEVLVVDPSPGSNPLYEQAG